MHCLSGVEQRIDVFIAFTERLYRRKSILQQRTDQWAIFQLFVLRPVVRIEIAVHQQFGEREAPQHNVVSANFPAPLTRDGFLDILEIGDRRQILCGRDFRQNNSKVRLETYFQSQVGFDISIIPCQSISPATTAFFQCRRNE